MGVAAVSMYCTLRMLVASASGCGWHLFNISGDNVNRITGANCSAGLGDCKLGYNAGIETPAFR
jgi:hypothetical protein